MRAMQGLLGAWALVGLAACSSEGVAAQQTVPEPVEAEHAPAALREPGYVAVVLAGTAVDVAPPTTGELLTVHVRPGDPVTAGQVLATLDDGDARAALRMAQARLEATSSALAVADIAVAEASRRLAAEKQLAGTGASSEQTLEQAEFDATRSVAERRSARAADAEQRAMVEQRRRELGETSVAAPIDGSIARLYRERGAAVGPSLPVVRIVGTAGVRIRFALPPERARALRQGDALRVEVETMDGFVGARVRQISAQIDPASHLTIVEGELEDAPAALRPGLGARVWVAE